MREVGGVGREARGRGVAATQAACTGGGLDSRLGGRARAERTANMPNMVVTLDVSKLSGWLNAYACCRVERRAYDAGRGARARRREGRGVEAAQAACMGRPD
eukprot:scaffold34414_cov60-Phaeocystis_antarctica.AAC.7